MASVADRVIVRAALSKGEHVLDVGTGTGIVVEQSVACVGPSGHVVGIDISSEMPAHACHTYGIGRCVYPDHLGR